MNNNSKFESIYKGEYVELFFLKKKFYPYKNQYSLDKQHLINHASGVENNLANNISISKIEENSELIKHPGDPSVYNYYFALNLSAFKNLRTFEKAGPFLKLKSLPETLKNLSFYLNSWNIETQSDLSIFTGFKNLENLKLGGLFIYASPNYPAWKGSLESLKDCKNLKFLNIGHITDITGLEYLPLDSLETVNLYGTPFDNLLFGDKTLDPNKLTTYSKEFSKEEVKNAIKIYQLNFWKEKTASIQPKEQIKISVFSKNINSEKFHLPFCQLEIIENGGLDSTMEGVSDNFIGSEKTSEALFTYPLPLKGDYNKKKINKKIDIFLKGMIEKEEIRLDDCWEELYFILNDFNNAASVKSSIYKHKLDYDFSSFVNLKFLHLGSISNYFYKIILPNNLVAFSSERIKHEQNIKIFSSLVNLEILDIGSKFKCKLWKGSLESLRKCKKIKYLNIRNLISITGSSKIIEFPNLGRVELRGTAILFDSEKKIFKPNNNINKKKYKLAFIFFVFLLIVSFVFYFLIGFFKKKKNIYKNINE